MLYLVALVIVVFTPNRNSDLPWFAFVLNKPFVEKLINITLFIPLSYFFIQLFKWFSIVKIFGMLLTFSTIIETVQIFIPGRVPDIKDVFLNTLGGVFSGVIFIRIIKS